MIDNSLKEFKTKNGLKKHFKITHDLEAEHQCNICQKVFNFPSQLSKHMKNFHDGLYHKCDSCRKSFSQAENLKAHISEVHNHQKDHKCDLCGKKFSRTYTLRKHIIKVHDVKT